MSNRVNQAVKSYTYADNITKVEQRLRVDEGKIQLQNYLMQLEQWLTINSLSAQGSRSSPAIVTHFNKEYGLIPLPRSESNLD